MRLSTLFHLLKSEGYCQTLYLYLHKYNIYFNNSIQTVGSSGQYAKYSVRRGSTSGGTTKVEGTFIRREDNEIFNLLGKKLEVSPSKGIYILNGKKILK